MKICYIWVESFRNFKNFGFNLSSEYKFNYSVEENFISLKKENILPNDFFGERIIDVIGIIGKNGAGKSNAVELLCKILKGSKTTMQSDFFIIAEIEYSLVCYCSFSNRENPHTDSRIRIEEYTGSVNPLKVVYFSNVFDGRKIEFNKEVADISVNKLSSRNLFYREKWVSDFEKQIKFVNSKAFLNLNIDLPTQVQLTSKVWSSRFNTSAGRYIHSKSNNIIDLKKVFRERLREVKAESKFIHLIRYGYFLDMIESVYRKARNANDKNLEHIEKLLEKIIPSLLNLKTEYIAESLIDFIQENIVFFITDQLNKDVKKSGQKEFYDIREKILKQLSFLKEIKNSLKDVEIVYNVEGSRSKEVEFFSIMYKSRDSKEFINDFVFLFGQSNFFEINWIGISSGHKAYLNLFSSIYQEIRFTRSYNLLICIDEGDLYLHPLWQTEFFNKLITVLPKIYPGDIQLVLTSHSPFLLSDLPNQNITILDKDAVGSSIDAIDLKTKTFGGNLYELYSEPFFLGQKRTSDFAYKKIKYLINKAEDKNVSKEEKQELIRLAKLVGDEIIQYRIKKLLGND
ncbi:AAA family ATPase [Spirosoma koreense]